VKKSGHFAIGAAATLIFGLTTASAAPLPVNISGYEFLLGTNCTINGQPGTCNVQFGGWTGGTGQVADGWTPFPGTDQGLWKATVNYTGKAEFGGQVDLVSGRFDLLFTNGTTVFGKVTGGTVTWPAAGESTVCGTDVAVVSVNVTFTSRGAAAGSGSFRGCLHDLPAGSVIPPKIWGTVQ
jgi:hypothetical protein